MLTLRVAVFRDQRSFWATRQNVDATTPFPRGGRAMEEAHPFITNASAFPSYFCAERSSRPTPTLAPSTFETTSSLHHHPNGQTTRHGDLPLFRTVPAAIGACLPDENGALSRVDAAWSPATLSSHHRHGLVYRREIEEPQNEEGDHPGHPNDQVCQ